jgi:hypothetical protein
MSVFKENILADAEVEGSGSVRAEVVPLVVSFGGGVNSAAMLVGMYERGIRPDLILFADTGGERPETYAFNGTMGAWLESRGFPDIVMVRNDGKYPSLEVEMLTRRTLPPIVMGFRTCSDKYKRRPILKYLKAIGVTKLTMAVGIDAGEPGRLGDFDTVGIAHQYPLVEWGWARPECTAAIQRVGLPVPIKSSCFFCPSMKPWEIRLQHKTHPELSARALAMEANNIEARVKGLGRHWAWRQVIKADEDQFKIFEEPQDIPCMCFDGEPDPQREVEHGAQPKA